MRLTQHTLLICLICSLAACGGLSEKQLIHAAYNGKTKLLEQAIIDGADVNTASAKDGVHLLAYAAGAGHASTVSMLLMHGAEIDKTDTSGWTALHFATSNGQLKVTDLLLVRDADINAKTSDGWTPLMYAIFSGHSETAKRLVTYGADTTVEVSGGLNAAAIAQSKGLDHLLSILQ